MMRRIEEGDMLMPGQFVTLKKETIEYMDKKQKPPQKATFNKLQYAVLSSKFGVVFVEIDERKIPDFDMQKFKSPFVSGQPVVAEVDQMTTMNGIRTIRGALHPVEP